MHEISGRLKMVFTIFAIFILTIAFFAMFLNRTIPYPKSKPSTDPEEIITNNPTIITGNANNTLPNTDNYSIIISGNNPKYQLNLPDTWKEMQEVDTESNSHQILLSSGNHEITISQLEVGQAICQYPEHPAVEKTSIQFDEYIEFTTDSQTKFRRSRLTTKEPVEGYINWTICQYEKTENEYLSPTSFGYIVYRTPAAYDKTLLSEMDQIITSIKPLAPAEE